MRGAPDDGARSEDTGAPPSQPVRLSRVSVNFPLTRDECVDSRHGPAAAEQLRRRRAERRAGGRGEVVKGVRECARPPGPKHDSPNHLAAPTRDPDHVAIDEHDVTIDEGPHPRRDAALQRRSGGLRRRQQDVVRRER
ncbi:hypothetical protein GCM10023221_27950 [Luteimicrobium xylanilyticum]